MKQLSVLILLTFLTGLGCAELKTRQFIVPKPPDQKNADSYFIGAWELFPPTFIAYKGTSDFSTIQNPHEFWLAFRAQHAVNDQDMLSDSLVIDTVHIDFVDRLGTVNRTETRIPSRATVFKNNRGSKFMAVFDYFENQGVVIPADISIIRLRLKVTVRMIPSKESFHKNLVIEMIRDEGETSLPFSGWR